MAGWIISLVGFILLFNVVAKLQEKGKNISTIRKIITCILCFHINWILSFILYEPIMEVLDISTEGFMNMNGLITAAVIWVAISITILVLAFYAKELLGPLYQTVRTTQKLFILLPPILLILFFFVVSFK